MQVGHYQYATGTRFRRGRLLAACRYAYRENEGCDGSAAEGQH